MEKINYLVLFGSVLFTVLGQMLMKIGGEAVGKVKPGIVSLLLAYMKSPFVLGGFALSAFAAIMWTYALSKFEFSYAYFVASFSYVLVIAISILFFKESISLERWIGCAFIVAGIFFVIRS